MLVRGPLRFLIRTQVVWGSRRADFVLCEEHSPALWALVVEVDDPSHWKDGAKAQHDRRRDREILCERTVFGTVRFTNAEIAADPIGAAQELLRVAEAVRQRAEPLILHVDERSPG